MVPSSVASCRLTLITEVATWLKLESTRGYGLGHGYGTIIVKNILVKVRWNIMEQNGIQTMPSKSDTSVNNLVRVRE